MNDARDLTVIRIYLAKLPLDEATRQSYETRARRLPRNERGRFADQLLAYASELEHTA